MQFETNDTHAAEVVTMFFDEFCKPSRQAARLQCSCMFLDDMYGYHCIVLACLSLTALFLCICPPLSPEHIVSKCRYPIELFYDVCLIALFQYVCIGLLCLSMFVSHCIAWSIDVQCISLRCFNMYVVHCIAVM